MSETPRDETRAETRAFQAHTQKLLDLMIHSVYTNREIFLRELISNSSDAIDKVRFIALTDETLRGVSGDYRIDLAVDAEAGTLTLADNGIGMSFDEVVENLGTIARSGTEVFLQELAARKAEGKEDPTGGQSSLPPDLIGRFGVGFYSAFMVADEVTVVTHKHGDEAGVRWGSTGDGTYTIEALHGDDVPARGTTITLKLKRATTGQAEAEGGSDDDGETNTQIESPAVRFTNRRALETLVKKYSDFVAFPVVMDVERVEYDRDDEGKIAKGAEARTVVESKTLNSMKPLWTRSKTEVSQSEYAEFYRHVTGDWEDPFDTVHLRIEGTHEYTSLMFVPKQPPADLYTRDHRCGLQLYVKNVFVMQECREILPEYLRFVRGLVDSPDLPLSLSREAVQQDRLIAAIRRHLTRKLLDRMAELLGDDRERYETFWQSYGAVLKEGFHYEPQNKDRLQKLLLFRSTGVDGWTTLAEYLERAPEAQKAVYLLSGEDIDRLRSAPQLEIFRKKGIEVLLAADPVDELMAESIGEVDGKPVLSAARGEVNFDDIPDAKVDSDADGADKQVDRPEQGQLDGLVAALKVQLDADVADVRLSSRLTDSAVCLVAPEGGMSLQMERMMRSMGQDMPAQKRVLEVNPDHPLIGRLAALAADDSKTDEVGGFGELLLDQALLSEGAAPRNPAEYVRRVTEVMTRAV